jgi:hypothetical protein
MEDPSLNDIEFKQNNFLAIQPPAVQLTLKEATSCIQAVKDYTILIPSLSLPPV